MPYQSPPSEPGTGGSTPPDGLATDAGGQGPTVAIIGEHGFLVHATAVMLADEGGFRVLEVHRARDDAARELRRANASLAIVGLTQMAPDEALGEVEVLRSAAPNTALIAIVRSPDPVLTRDMLSAGVRGCITRRSTAEEFFQAIHRVLDGDAHVSPELAVALASFADSNGPADLSVREKEVLRLVGLGLTNREIARMMHLSVRTVETHRASLQRKLGTTRRADLVNHAAASGLLG